MFYMMEHNGTRKFTTYEPKANQSNNCCTAKYPIFNDLHLFECFTTKTTRSSFSILFDCGRFMDT